MPNMTEWTLVAAALLLLMQCGFALVLAGFARAQNVTHTLIVVVLLHSVALLGFWGVGYAVQAHGALFLGTTVDGAEFARFLFLALVAAIAVVIPAGTLMERWRFSSVVFTSLALSTVIYPLVARWVWGGGWMAQLGVSAGLGHGVVDFAGSGVVHLVSGVVALGGALAIGPRAHKFTYDGLPQAMPGHNVPMFMVASMMLIVGWFGLVIGLGLPQPTAPLALAAANGVLASASSAVAAIAYMRWRLGAPDPSLVSNALVAGIVSISAGCAFVSVGAAVVIGAVSGVLVITSVLVIERRMRIDDPAGTISIHGTCGAWGLIAAGLFANGHYGDGLNGVAGPVAGLFYGAASQVVAQFIGTIATIAFALVATYVLFQVLRRFVGNRVSHEAELDGLDVAELGTTAYPDFGTASRDSSH
jgi:Amt family ammonium transporter